MANDIAKKERQIAKPRRGDIYVVAFDPARGHEIQKTRPALIIQNNIGNQYSPITIPRGLRSAPNSIIPPHPTDIVVETTGSGLSQRSAIVLNQIRSVDRQRLLQRLGRLDGGAMQRVDQALKISLGLVDLA